MVLFTIAINFDAVMVIVRYIIEQKSQKEDYNQHYYKCHLLLKVSMALTGCRMNSESKTLYVDINQTNLYIFLKNSIRAVLL